MKTGKIAIIVSTILAAELVGLGLGLCQPPPDYLREIRQTQQATTPDFVIYPSQSNFSYSRIIRIIDTKAGVVCYANQNAIFCLPLKDTNLR